MTAEKLAELAATEIDTTLIPMPVNVSILAILENIVISSA